MSRQHPSDTTDSTEQHVSDDGAMDALPGTDEDPSVAVDAHLDRARELQAQHDDPEGILEAADLAAAESDDAPDNSRLVISIGEDGTANARPLLDETVKPDDASGMDDTNTIGGTPDGDGADRFADVPEQFAADVAVRTDHGVATQEVRTNDVREAFGDLLRWYAACIAPDEDPREVIELLLASGALDE